MTTTNFALAQLNKDIEAKEQEIRDSIRFLQKCLLEAVQCLDSGRSPNSAGIVQGNGNQIDRLMGELSALYRIRQFWSQQ